MGKPTHVTNEIRRLRFAHGEMTQAELAERVGVTRQTIIAIEQGRYSPSLEMAFQIAGRSRRRARRRLRVPRHEQKENPDDHLDRNEHRKPGGSCHPDSSSAPPGCVHRAMYRLSGGRFGLRPASEKAWGMMRLQDGSAGRAAESESPSWATTRMGRTW